MSFDQPDQPDHADLPAEFAGELPIELVPAEAVEAPPRRPRVWSVFVVFLFALGAAQVVVPTCIVLALVFGQYGTTLRSPADFERAILDVATSPTGFLSMGAGMLMTVGAVAVIAALLSPVRWRDRLQLRAVGISPAVLLAGILGVPAIGLACDALDGLGLMPRSPALEMFAEVVQGLSGPSLVAAVLVIGVMPGIAEELLFRGYIQTRLVARWGPGWGIFWTSLMFGLMHMDLVQGGFAVGTGILLGYLTYRTGTLWPAMVGHAANNILSVLLTAENVEIGGFEMSLACLAGSLVLLGLCFWAIHRFAHPPEPRPAEEELLCYR